MNTKYRIVKQLLDLLEDYEKNSEAGLELHHFIAWLKQKDTPKPNLDVTGQRIDDEIAALFCRMHRFSNSYAKVGLANSPFLSSVDFGFAATVLFHKEIGKTELIKAMVYEKSSGMEIIKRLIKEGILEQFDNPEDKRSKLIKVTNHGQKLITSSFESMAKISDVINAKLTYNKQLQLLSLLKELDVFHTKVYNYNYEDLNAIIDNYIKKE